MLTNGLLNGQQQPMHMVLCYLREFSFDVFSLLKSTILLVVNLSYGFELKRTEY